MLGIPDLRVYEDPLIPIEDDYKKGDKIHAQSQETDFAGLVRYYWTLPTYPPTPPELSRRFVDHVLTDEQRAERYRGRLGSGANFLEVGCGTAALTRVVQEQFTFAIASDVAFRWLLIARKRLEEAGAPARLVCCCADYLPFAPETFDAVASVAVLERLDDAGSALKEACRVSASGGRVFAWTANRYSIAPEPHVRVWGVGFLPRHWMPGYVRWMRGMAYDKIRLLSLPEVRRLCAAAGLTNVTFEVPELTPADWAHLRGLERIGARVYASAARIPGLRWLLRFISPVLLFVARRGPAKVAAPESKPAMQTGRQTT